MTAILWVVTVGGLGFLLLLGLCTVAGAADAQTEEMLRDGHEHY